MLGATLLSAAQGDEADRRRRVPAQDRAAPARGTPTPAARAPEDCQGEAVPAAISLRFSTRQRGTASIALTSALNPGFSIAGALATNAGGLSIARRRAVERASRVAAVACPAYAERYPIRALATQYNANIRADNIADSSGVAAVTRSIAVHALLPRRAAALAHSGYVAFPTTATAYPWSANRWAAHSVGRSATDAEGASNAALVPQRSCAGSCYRMSAFRRVRFAATSTNAKGGRRL